MLKWEIPVFINKIVDKYYRHEIVINSKKRIFVHITNKNKTTFN